VTDDRYARIRARLSAGFPGSTIELEDESHLHAGHAGARSGRGHYRVRIESETFAGMSLIARHRAVYAALGELMQTDIHALSIDAQTRV
jgi:BolA family transcriptional regulator, general stress-responsive regulator